MLIFYDIFGAVDIFQKIPGKAATGRHGWDNFFLHINIININGKLILGPGLDRNINFLDF